MDVQSFKPMRRYSVLLALSCSETVLRLWNKRLPSHQAVAQKTVVSREPGSTSYPSPRPHRSQ